MAHASDVGGRPSSGAASPQAVFEVEASWSADDCARYALALGLGRNPMDPFNLQFVTENTEGVPQAVLPSFALVIPAAIDEVMRGAASFDWERLLHAEQSLRVHRPLGTSGVCRSRSTLRGVYDKGSGALIVVDTHAIDIRSGESLWTATSSAFVRGAGGFDGPKTASDDWSAPDRVPDRTLVCMTETSQALAYRQCGDRNPLHSDPSIARRAGFRRPILHGLCTLGMALATVEASRPAGSQLLGQLDCRFRATVIPGDDLTVNLWNEGDKLRFEVLLADGSAALHGRAWP